MHLQYLQGFILRGGNWDFPPKVKFPPPRILEVIVTQKYAVRLWMRFLRFQLSSCTYFVGFFNVSGCNSTTNHMLFLKSNLSLNS